MQETKILGTAVKNTVHSYGIHKRSVLYIINERFTGGFL